MASPPPEPPEDWPPENWRPENWRPETPEPGTPVRSFGAPRAAAVPRVENVRLTRPDLERRAALERTRARLKLAAGGLGFLFVAVMVKLTWATIILPMPSPPGERSMARLFEAPPTADAPREPVARPARTQRATITDRNGETLAVSLPTAALYANPKEMIDIAQVASKLKTVLPRLDEEQVRARLGNAEKQFVYLARQLTPREQISLNALGIPGVYFEQTERRSYPMKRTAAQVVGGVDVDGHGVAGVERFFERRLAEDSTPLRLSIDVRVQAVVRDELVKGMQDFRAIGGCGIVMDVRTGEVIAMVSLPDYDANLAGRATNEERFNRAVTGMYEPGSTYKLQTLSMALDYGTVQLWNEFDASRPIQIGRFTISDFEGKKRWLYLPEVLAYSSNIGAAHVAQTVGAERQRAWLRNMGMFSRVGIELPEAGLPLVQSAQAWKEIVTLTVAFGHGISVSPLHVVRGTAAIANNGVIVRPTLIAQEPGNAQDTGNPPPDARQVMQPATSDTMRRLMRLVVTDGFGKTAEVPGYYPGGKTGTAEKVGNRTYNRHANVAAFTSVFPMNAPRYAVYMMLDEPHANASTHGYATAGWVVAPSAGRVIARVGPMLGMLPDTAHAAEINAALAIPLQPARPPTATRSPPVAGAQRPALPPGAAGQPPRENRQGGTPVPAVSPRPPAAPPAGPAPRDLRHEAGRTTPTPMIPAQYVGSPLAAR